MWAQPWAWLGLAGLAVPIAIHLLARHQAVRAAFPTLRFIDPSELNAIKRQRLTDIPLLLVRLLIVALAVAAIAGPRWGAAPLASGRDVATATVIDTSASAAPASATTTPTTSASTNDDRQVQIGTTDLGAGLDAAIAWAERRAGRREIVVRSDFPHGALNDADIRRVPDGIGLRLERVPSRPLEMPAGFSRDGASARMVWPVAAMATPAAIAVHAGPDQDNAERMLAAALSVAGPVTPVAHGPVTVIFPGASDRASMAQQLQLINEAWMFNVAAPLISDTSARVQVGAGRGGLVVLTDADPQSLEAAELVTTIANALNQETAASESETRVIADADLQAWSRAPVAADVQQAGEPQGRWLWMIVVVLLIVETLMRRRAV